MSYYSYVVRAASMMLEHQRGQTIDAKAPEPKNSGAFSLLGAIDAIDNWLGSARCDEKTGNRYHHTEPAQRQVGRLHNIRDSLVANSLIDQSNPSSGTRFSQGRR